MSKLKEIQSVARLCDFCFKKLFANFSLENTRVQKQLGIKNCVEKAPKHFYWSKKLWAFLLKQEIVEIFVEANNCEDFCWSKKWGWIFVEATNCGNFS